MSKTILKEVEQRQVSLARPMPVDAIDGTTSLITYSGETVSLFYYNAGVQTADAGQAAGKIVVAKLAHEDILNQLGDVIGTYKDTSLVLTATCLTTEVAFPFDAVQNHDDDTGSNKANAVVGACNNGTGLLNGQYCVDYRTGKIYGKKADATFAVTAAYQVKSQASTVIGPASNVNLASVGGAAVASPLPVSVSGLSPATVLLDGSVTAAAATPTALGASAVGYVLVQAKPTNTKTITVGNAASQNIVLAAGDAWSFGIDNLSKVYFTTQVNGEGINYSAA